MQAIQVGIAVGQCTQKNIKQPAVELLLEEATKSDQEGSLQESQEPRDNDDNVPMDEVD